MEKIESFKINHDTLQKGMYISRIDGDIVTYDIRMKRPNMNDFLSNGTMHTFEHLFATYARNTEFQDKIVYVGPMGCRTGLNDMQLLERWTVRLKNFKNLCRI